MKKQLKNHGLKFMHLKDKNDNKKNVTQKIINMDGKTTITILSMSLV